MANSRKYNTFISPKIILRNLIIVVDEMLHEGDTLPARDAELWSKRVEPSSSVEGIVLVFS